MFALIEQHPGAVNLRPEFRVFGVIHQAAYHGVVAVLRRLVEECRADAGLLTRDKKTAVQVALDSAKLDAVKYLGSLSLPGGSSGAGTEAHAVIDAAKDGKWEAVFRLLGEGPPGLVNIRPGVRRYSVLHQAAFHGDIEVLRRLIEDFKADVKQLTDEGQNALEIARLEKHDAAAKYLEACVPNVKLDDDFVTYPEQRFVTLGEDELQTFRDLLRKTHKKACNWTRDRDQASGKHVDNTPVPTGYELVGVRRNENPALWRIYQVSREIMRLSCQSNESFAPWSPLTAEGLDWSPLGLCAGANEWLLLHAGLPEALSAIAGGLYGSGTYFADSITKADEYARRKVEEKGVFKGCRAVAVVRVLGGRHYYTDKEVGEADKPKFAKRVLEGEYHSTVGDRLKLKNTYREYVAYDSACTYLEFILYLRKGVPDKHK
ncbi:unnamed protein product [Prorocentrum cordatum]|uniref:Poly [ADP-ribose] polymerase n=1 Tax=Prorocentrum cordatum TaxID=2364126 RepID=A0ABN9SUM0_9DINO|nr:unnamed protein product [Polarella glacialis]